jgi:tRNA/rRNA methyltransferase
MTRTPPVAPVEADAFPLNELRVVLVSPRNPLNIGAAARAMSNFGCTRLRVVAPYDIAFQEARSAVGASAILKTAELCESVASAVADCSLVVGTTSVAHRELQHPLRRLEYGGRLLRRHLLRGAAALLFGCEKYGLSNEDLSHCHWLVRIPARREHGSMNLGQAVAVCLYELIRTPAAAAAVPRRSQAAPAADLERLGALLLEVLEISGYVNPRTAASTALKARRLVRRMGLNARDAETLAGMIRQVRWKLDAGAGSEPQPQ